DFNTLINEGKKYNASIGVHINATEYAKDAFEVKPELINENAPGWAWLDKTFYTDQRKDITSGELFRRLDMLKSDAPDLGWVYVDVYTGNGWNAHKLAEKMDQLDYTFATEMNGPLEQDVVWTHWGGDPAYPNKGNASKIMRFIKNDTHDTFLADPLIKGNKHLLSGGWGSRHDIEGEYGVEVFYNQVLPTKYLQHFPIVKMSEKEVLFENGVRSAEEGENINYYRDDRLVATTPKNSIGSTGIGDTQLFLPWNPVEEDEKIYHWNPLSTSSTWELPDNWKNLGTIQLYELDDLGRTFVKDVKVENGKVKLDVEKDTPYLVMKGKVKENRINDWGYGAQIKDPGFDSQTWNNWEKDSEAKDTKHIQIINEKTSGRNGNDLVKVSGNDGANAEISQEIKGLQKGATYSVSAWVKNEGNREIELEVEGEEVEVETKMDEVFYQRNGEGVKFRNDKFTRIEVEFTADDDEAEISLEIGKGVKDSEVYVDDFRIWEHPGHTNKDGYVFYEDFENVDEGITPFFLAEGRGNSNRTHLAEKNIFGSQYKHWTLDGRFSLKSNQQPDEQGQMFVTEDSTFKLKPNKTYELGFLYSLADAKPGYTFNIKSKSEGTLLSIDLDSTNVSGQDLTNAKEVSQKFTTGNTDDYYISVDKNKHSGDIVQLILDNVYVKELNESIKNPELKYVNLNTMVNELKAGQEVEFDLNALMNNGEDVDLSKASVEYKVSNPKVLEIKDGKMVAKSKGKSNVFVKVRLGKKVVMSNHVTINVK
ncbi:MAG: endo-alpha-N-acetylgalactosaminidase family protein, partial [Peptostreptococcaceae bacterium]